MKRLNFLMLAIIAFALNLSAYDYQAVYSHRTALFSNANGSVLGMRIDSVKFAQDSVLYPLKNIQNLTNDCYSPQGASWLGAKIIVGRTWNYFLNHKGDTIKIKTGARVGETWEAYMAEGIKVTATVQKVEEVSFLGLKDSVKTIVFKGAVLTSSGAPAQTKASLSADSGGDSIQISKRYGLLTTFDFLNFPNYQGDIGFDFSLSETYTGAWEPLRLIGLTNPTVGTQNLTWFEVNDFQVGDELHVDQLYSPFFGQPTLKAIETKIILKYLDRHDYKDSIVYEIDKILEKNDNSSGQLKRTYSHDTIRSVIYKDSLFDQLPGGNTVFRGSMAYSNRMYIGSSSTKVIPSDCEAIYGSDNCWGMPICDGCIHDNAYYKGLGGPYYKCDNGLDGSGEENKLVYYKKASSTWGTPHVISGIKQPQSKIEISVYPNPAADKVFVYSELLAESCTFELIDLNGLVLLRSNVDANRNSISLDGLAKGLYLYRLNSNGKLLKAGKIVKN